MLSTHQRLNVKYVGDSGNGGKKTKNPHLFNDFLAGVTDGDGCFSFSINKRQNNIWNCTFKIGSYDMRLLNLLKNKLSLGSINKKSGLNSAEWRIRDRATLLKTIVPLFHKHKLYSTKHFYFLRWQRALEILEYHKGSSAEKHQLLTKLRQESPPEGYTSPHWKDSTPSDQWVLGFVEAEGSFFLTKKGTNPAGVARVVHSFGITQKLDPQILTFLRNKFNISSVVQHTAGNFYKLETTNGHSLNLIRLFFNDRLRGVKSLEYRIWARSMKSKGDYETLLRVQSLMRKIRNSQKT